MTIEFGCKAKDRITGFSGTVTGISTYISGCTQVLLAPSVGKDGAERMSAWFDLQRLQRLPGKPLVLDTSAPPGPDREAPRR